MGWRNEEPIEMGDEARRAPRRRHQRRRRPASWDVGCGLFGWYRQLDVQNPCWRPGTGRKSGGRYGLASAARTVFLLIVRCVIAGGIEDLEDAVADPAMPDPRSTPHFAHDAVLRKRSEELRCTWLADPETFLYVAHCENRVGEQQVYDFWSPASAPSESRAVSLPKVGEELGTVNRVRRLHSNAVEKET